MAAAKAFTARRLAVTVLPPLAVLLVGHLSVPGLHLDRIGYDGAGVFDSAMLGMFTFGVNPIVSAYLYIEIAALIVPGWRSLRHDPEGRAVLRRRVKPLTLILASLQTFFMLRWLNGTVRLYPGINVLPESNVAWFVVAAAPIAGPLILLWLADLISEHGFGNGLSVLIVGTAIPDLVKGLVQSVQARTGSGERVLLPLGLAAMVVAALAVSTARRPTAGWDRRPPRPDLPLPISALLPLGACIFLLNLPRLLATFDVDLGALPRWLVPATASDAAVRFPVLAVLGAAFAWLFARPSLVAPLWRRSLRALAAPTEPAERDLTGDGATDGAGEGGADERAEPAELAEPVVGEVVSADATLGDLALARAAYRRALWATLLFLGALAFVDWLDAGSRLVVNAPTLLVIGCVALDVVGELRFRRTHPDLAAITAEHRLYTVGPALAALAAAGIPAFPRALRHRALLWFWGPHLPIEILVPRGRADQAHALLAIWSFSTVTWPAPPPNAIAGGTDERPG